MRLIYHFVLHFRINAEALIRVAIYNVDEACQR